MPSSKSSSRWSSRSSSKSKSSSTFSAKSKSSSRFSSRFSSRSSYSSDYSETSLKPDIVIGKWTIPLDEPGVLPDRFIMLKHVDSKTKLPQIYTFPTSHKTKIEHDGIEDGEIVMDVSGGNGYLLHTTSSGIVDLSDDIRGATLFFIQVPVEVVQTLQELIRQKYGKAATKDERMKRHDRFIPERKVRRRKTLG